MSPLLLLISTCLTASPAPWLLYTEQVRDAPSANLVAARPDERLTLLTLDVLPNYAPHARLSPEGRTLFLIRHTVPNHLERTGELLAFDLVHRTLRPIAQGVDAEPPLALSDEAVAWFETLEVQSAPPDSAMLDRATISIRASIAGRMLELARLAGIHGVHFAGIADSGIVLYVVTPEEAAFYLLPLDARLIQASRAPIRQARAATGTFAKAAIEVRDDMVPASGLMRIAAAPTGPVAREFTVQGKSLFFGALTRDRTASALYSLAIPDLDTRPTRATGSAAAATPIAAQELALTGRRSPGPLLAGDRLLFAQSIEHGERLEMRLLSSLTGAVPPMTATGAHPHSKGRTLLKTRGTLRALAIDEKSQVLAVRRTFASEAELLWIDPSTSAVRRLRPQELYEVIDFVEGIE